jgi:hypothetical protein
MKKKYFCEETMFEFIWNGADRDGMWDGNNASIAVAFGISEHDAYATLSELCDRGLIQQLEPAKFIITEWQERENIDEEEPN